MSYENTAPAYYDGSDTERFAYDEGSRLGRDAPGGCTDRLRSSDARRAGARIYTVERY
jgi:hypothetical protein